MRYVALYDIYGKLLTKNQAKMFESYYLCDLSLREIAQNEYVTFQAVRSALKTCEKQLDKFESMVHMYDALKGVKEIKNEISKDKIDKEKIYDIIEKIEERN